MAVQVVQLVLVEPRLEVDCLDRDLPAVEVVTGDVDLLGPGDPEIEPRYRQAPLFVLPFAVEAADDRVDESAGPAVAYLIDEETAPNADLWRRQPQTLGGFHGGVHVFGQPRDPPVDLSDLFSTPLEHGVTESPDPVGSHLSHVATFYGDRGPWAQLSPLGGTGASSGKPSRLGPIRLSRMPPQPSGMADHYFTATPSAPSRPGHVELSLPDMQLELLADRGVFSGGRVDPGTLTLLRESPPPPAVGDLLDLGCGYGPIACALARRSPAATVWAIDVNSRALELTSSNATSLGLANVRSVNPDEVPPGVVFSGIWSNPPVRVGKEALHELLSTWLARLDEGARAWLVVNRHLGSDSLADWLGANGWAVRRAASKSGYRVLEVAR